MILKLVVVLMVFVSKWYSVTDRKAIFPALETRCRSAECCYRILNVKRVCVRVQLPYAQFDKGSPVLGRG